MRPDDAFWAARIVSKFSDAAVRAIVEKARYSDPGATEYISATLIKRRDKVLATWLNQVNPVVDVTLDATRHADVQERRCRREGGDGGRDATRCAGSASITPPIPEPTSVR